MPAITINMDVATATGDAPAPTETVGPGLSVPLPAATALGDAKAFDLSLSAAYYGFGMGLAHADGLALDMAISIGTPAVPGDFFAQPILLTGLSGTGHVDLADATLETGEDTALAPSVFATVGSRSLWLRYTAPQAGTFTFTALDPSTTGYRIAVIQAAAIDDPNFTVVAEQEADGVNDPTVSIAISRYESVYVYVATVTGSSGTFPNALAYAWGVDTAATFDAVMTIEPKLYDRTPTAVVVSVINMDPNEDVQFQVIGNPAILATIAADDFGGILGVSVPVGLPLPAGTYTLQAHGTGSGLTVTDTFTLLHAPLDRPAAPTADTPVSPPTQSGVQRWVFQDPTTGGLGTYIFPTNPAKASSPFRELPVTIEHTVAQDGVAVIWEGSPVAHPMTFSGFTDAPTFVSMMKSFIEIRRKFYFIDHRGRVWTATLTEFGEDRRTKHPERGAEFPWSMNYTGKLLLFAGPM